MFPYCFYVYILDFSQYLISIFTIDCISAWFYPSIWKLPLSGCNAVAFLTLVFIVESVSKKLLTRKLSIPMKITFRRYCSSIFILKLNITINNFKIQRHSQWLDDSCVSQSSIAQQPLNLSKHFTEEVFNVCRLCIRPPINDWFVPV